MLHPEDLVVRARASIGGIPSVVRWLRNPRPALVPEVLRRYGAQIGDGVTFKGAVLFDNVAEDADSAGDFAHLRIGDNVYVGDCVYFDLAAPIDVAENVMISARASVITHRDLNRSSWLSEHYPRRREAVTIEHGASLSACATMLAGSRLATESILAAGALLAEGQSTEPRSVWAGVPARAVKSIDSAG